MAQIKREYDVSDAEMFAKAWECHQEFTGTYGTDFKTFDSATFTKLLKWSLKK